MKAIFGRPFADRGYGWASEDRPHVPLLGEVSDRGERGCVGGGIGVDENELAEAVADRPAGVVERDGGAILREIEGGLVKMRVRRISGLKHRAFAGVEGCFCRPEDDSDLGCSEIEKVGGVRLEIGVVRPEGEGVVAVFHGDEDEDKITAGSRDGGSAEGAESFAVFDGGAEGEDPCFQFLPLAELLGFEDEFTGGFAFGIAELDFGDVFKEAEGEGADGQAIWFAFRDLGGEGEGGG